MPDTRHAPHLWTLELQAGPICFSRQYQSEHGARVDLGAVMKTVQGTDGLCARLWHKGQLQGAWSRDRTVVRDMRMPNVPAMPQPQPSAPFAHALSPEALGL